MSGLLSDSRQNLDRNNAIVKCLFFYLNRGSTIDIQMLLKLFGHNVRGCNHVYLIMRCVLLGLCIEERVKCEICETL